MSSLFNHPIYLIAFYTIREIRRQKIFYFLLSVAIFLIVSGFVLGSISLNEKARLSINFSLVACQVSCILIAVFFAVQLIGYELESQSIEMLLTKPISRSGLVIGRLLGLVITLIGVLCTLTSIVAIIMIFYGREPSVELFVAMWGIFLEALLLINITFFFSMIFSPFLTYGYCFLTFIIGHSVNELTSLLISNKDNYFETAFLLIAHVLPDLEKTNWRTQVLYQDSIPNYEIVWNTTYMLLWTLCFLILSVICFEKKSLD